MTAPRNFALSQTAPLLLRDLGLDPAAILRRADLPGDLFSRLPASIPPAQYYALWRAMEAEAGVPDLPLRVGRVISTELFDPPIFAAVCSPELTTAAHRIARYKALCGPLKLDVREDEHGLHLQMTFPEADTPTPRVFMLLEAVFWVGLARLATRHAVRPRKVILPRLPEADIAPAYAEWLGVPIEQGPRLTVSFSAADARRPFLTANEGMWTFFEPELRRRLGELEAGASTEDRVRAALVELLPSGRASMAVVGKTLGMSSRTLQRRLKGEGRTFQGLLADTRESLALHYLRSSQMSAPEISFLLGYADPNSFYRAFHDWTGTTPEAARARA
jgi:AraC-like DNA-binding protein